MRIDIDGNYGIKTDAHNFILGVWESRKDKETGEVVDYLKSVAYCSSLTNVLREYKKKTLLDSTAESFDDVNKLLVRVEDKIDEISEELGI